MTRLRVRLRRTIPGLPRGSGSARSKRRDGVLGSRPAIRHRSARRAHLAARARGPARAAGRWCRASLPPRSIPRGRSGNSSWSTTTKAAARSSSRIHHWYADGIALVRVMLSMTDVGAGRPAGDALRAAAAAQARGRVDQLLGAAHGAARQRAADGARHWRRWSRRAPRYGRIPPRPLALAEQGTALTAEIAKLAHDGPGFADALQGHARRRQAGRVGGAPAADRGQGDRHARSAPRSTTCCSRASPARCANISSEKGDATDGVMMRALVPVNLRPLEKAYKLGNQFGLVFLELPIGIENPVERLYAVRGEHARAEGQLPAGARARPARRDGRRPEAPAGAAACTVWRATRAP